LRRRVGRCWRLDCWPEIQPGTPAFVHKLAVRRAWAKKGVSTELLSQARTGDYPDGKQGDVLLVEFTVAGIPFIGLNGGPAFKQSEAFSFQIATDDQAETDRLWNAIVGNGGQESECGWCKDRWGLSWQITPRVLPEAARRG
jgi:predicted 3-demethylubiquinone-9 3-methyltransferase (glyoxalase superfamily)